MKINRVIVTLLITVGYAVALPRVPWLSDRAVFATVALVVALGGWAFLQHAWADAWIGGSIALTLIGAKALFGGSDDLYMVLVTAAILAFGFLSFALLIGPWSWFFHRRFLRLVKHRRHVGVASLLLAFLHVNIVLVVYYNSQLPIALLISANVFGTTTLYLMELLGLTSWDWAQRKIPLRWWNVIHTVALVPYLGIVALGWHAPDLTGLGKTLLVAIALYWLILSPWRVQLTSRRTPNGWKQLHRLVYAAYAAVVIHVWTGVVSNRPPAIQLLFWTPVLVVLGSHGVGWWQKLRLQARRRHVAPQPPAVSPPVSPA